MKTITTMIISLLFTAAAATAGTTYSVDAAHTNVNFSVSHMVISSVTGQFKDVSGTLETSKDDFSDAKISIVIASKSISTDNDKRDEHLRSADFFDAEKYPQAIFTSKAIKKTGDNTYIITGDLTMHGVTNTLELAATFKGKVKSPWGQTVAAFKGSTTIKRGAWGLKWNKALEAGGMLVGDDVELTFNVELVQE